MTVFIDDIENEILIHELPKRIVSTVPSQTELLYDLGIDDRIVGITEFCVHPTHFHNEKTIIGGTKNLKIKKILELDPDLIIANKEENIRGQILRLSKDIPVYVHDVRNFDDAIKMIRRTGEITETYDKAVDIVDNILLSFNNFIPIVKNLTTLYLIWKDPYMSVSNNTFIGSILNKCGLINICGDSSENYPVIENFDIEPELILLPSEPYNFTKEHIPELRNYFPNARILFVDGEMFSWYGSRMIKAASYLKKLFE